MPIEKIVRGLFWASIVFAVSLPVRADKKEDAKKHFDSGNVLVDAEDYAAAAVEFETSVALYATKGGLFNLGNCYKALHRYPEALAVFERVIKEFGPTLNPEMRADTEKRIAEIQKLIAEVNVEVSEKGARVTLDGQETGTSPLDHPILLGPGEHVFKAVLEGFEDVEQKITLASGEKKRVDMVLRKKVPPPAPVPAPVVTPPPVPPRSGEGSLPSPAQEKKQMGKEAQPEEGPTVSWLFWTAAGVTVASAVMTGVFGGLSNKRFDDYKGFVQDYTDRKIQADDKDLVSAKDDVQLYDGLTIGFGVATGVFAAATVVVLVLDLTGKGIESGKVTAAPSGVIVRF